jgi:hypothetical protein
VLADSFFSIAAKRYWAMIFGGCGGKPADKQTPHEQRPF